MFLSKPLIRTASALALAGALLAAGAAQAQRDPAYAAARAAGQVGEKMDGYLGVVGGSNPTLQRLVDDINIQRRAVYTKQAQEQKATVVEYAFTTGCLNIQRTTAGEMYQAADGSWKKRTAAAPDRDPRCP